MADLGMVKEAAALTRKELRELDAEQKRVLKESGKVSDDITKRIANANARLGGYNSQLTGLEDFSRQKRDLKGAKKDAKDIRNIAQDAYSLYGSSSYFSGGFGMGALSLAADKDVREFAERGLKKAGFGKAAAALGTFGGPVAMAAMTLATGVKSGLDTRANDTQSLRDISRMANRGEITGAEQQAARKVFEQHTYWGLNASRGEAAQNFIKGVKGAAGAFGGKSQEEIKSMIDEARKDTGFRAGLMSSGPLAEEIHRRIQERISKEESKLRRGLTDAEREAQTRAAIADAGLTQETMDAVIKRAEAREDAKQAKSSKDAGTIVREYNEAHTRAIDLAGRRTPARIGD